VRVVAGACVGVLYEVAEDQHRQHQGRFADQASPVVMFIAGHGEWLVVVVRGEHEAGLQRGRRRALRPVRLGGLMSALRRLPRVRWAVLAALAVLAAALAYVVFALVRSAPATTVIPAPRDHAFAGRLLRLAWPRHGEAAVAVQGVGLIGSHGSRRPSPIASLAKVMTAYVVLRDHPLHGGGGGLQITVTSADVAVYRADGAAGQSVVAVRAGERLTERRALEGLLLPSGNNIATLLARWDAGSERAFVAKMNARARALGLRHTRYRDASGVRAGTASTALDQVRLALRAIEIPAFRQTVAMMHATLPIAGRQYNKDTLLGKNGIVGIKTGTTSQAGACFMFAAHQRLGRRSITVVGAVLHQPAGRALSIASAFHATTALLASTRRILVARRVITRGATLAWITASWADPVALKAAGSVTLRGWPGLPVRTSIATARHIQAPVNAGQHIGTALVSAGEQRATVQLVASRALPDASVGWRLAHP
jgi:D-alanyl-D-alanine carboxypeptidase (penicillin-binding protein 5/6)